MLSLTLTLLVDMAAQLAWPVTQALFHSLWIGILVVVCLRLLEQIVGRSAGESGEAGRCPEVPARHRFALSLTALAFVAASLPVSFSLVFDRDAFDEAVAAARRSKEAVSGSSVELLAATPIAQVLDDFRSAESSASESLAEPVTAGSQANVWHSDAFESLWAEARQFAPAIAALYGVEFWRCWCD